MGIKSPGRSWTTILLRQLRKPWRWEGIPTTWLWIPKSHMKVKIEQLIQGLPIRYLFWLYPLRLNLLQTERAQSSYFPAFAICCALSLLRKCLSKIGLPLLCYPLIHAWTWLPLFLLRGLPLFGTPQIRSRRVYSVPWFVQAWLRLWFPKPCPNGPSSCARFCCSTVFSCLCWLANQLVLCLQYLCNAAMLSVQVVSWMTITSVVLQSFLWLKCWLAD